ncbi:hypothetical protein HYT92_00795 [Candidatus Pacearchaeota archaeon]|nr:hypothetical protein [Candidatus Pacearchaeota archaeon]
MVDFISSIKGVYESIIGSVPPQYSILINLFLFTLLIVIYAVFIWKFYRFLATKDIIKLDLAKYNKSTHPALRKFFASVLYLIEYIIISPFLIFFWFAILSVFLILLSKEQGVETILLISAAVVASVRMTSYYKEDLSRDLSKMFPFTLLAIFLLTPNFFSIPRFISQITQIPLLLNNILYYLLFIVGVEIILRFFSMLFSIGNKESEEDETAEKEKEQIFLACFPAISLMLMLPA